MVEQAGGPQPAFGAGSVEPSGWSGGGPPAMPTPESAPPPTWSETGAAPAPPTAGGDPGPPEPLYPVVDPNATPAQAMPAIPPGGGPPGWAPGMPLPGEPGGAPLPPEMDFNLLNDSVVQARERELHYQFKPAYDAAGSDVERNAINMQYQAAVQLFRAGVERARERQDAWAEQTKMHYALMAMVPKMREMRAGELAEKYKAYGVSADQLLTDEHGRAITNRQEMEMRAYYMARANYQMGVRARGGRDAGLAPVGGQPSTGPDDISRMSRQEFLQFREANRKSGGALLYRLGNG